MILVIDGNNIAYRSFHTAQGELTTKAGEPSGVMLGTLNSLRGYLDKFPEATRMVVVFDGGKAKWRKEIYPEYKANRNYGADSPEEKAKFEGLFKQIDTLNEFLPSLGVYSIKLKGWEADDIISELCKTATKHGKNHVMVVTTDKDMLQLVSRTVSVYRPGKDVIVSPLNFYEQTGVTQEAYIGYRALVGDTSDNIIGVQGIGEKTAKNLMDAYGTIDNVLGSRDVKAKLLKSKRTAKIFEPDSLNRLGINNKIMNFNYVPYDPEVEDHVNTSLGVYMGPVEEAPLPLSINTKEVKSFLMKWQFLSLLTNFMPFVTPFMGLGEED